MSLSVSTADSPYATPAKGSLAAMSPEPSPNTWQQNSADGNPADYRSSTPLPASSPSPSPAAASASAVAAASSSSAAAAPSPNNILVSIRLRPVNEREKQNGEELIWRTSASNNSIEEVNDTLGKRYSFDYICPPEESTTELYKNLVRKVVLKACIGYNSNVFAYGQTASGKTYTTLGNEFSPGIVLLAIGDIFHYIAQSPNRQFLLRISCVEIYNEEINDLLNPDPVSGRNLKLENVGGLNKDGTLNPFATNVGVKIKGLTQEFVRSPQEFIALLLRGEENRKIASTDANLRSSRSHTLFRIHIESRARMDPSAAPAPSGASKKIRSSLLTFVDLAGSECISQLGGSLERQKECRHINKSLLGLSRVIVKLSEGADIAGGHIPFRDSKITRLLQPALGGNSHTLFICCLSPNASCKEESHNTLRFGSFANRVQNVARVNLKEEKVKEDIARYTQELERLREEMEKKRLEEMAELDKLRATNEELKLLLKQKDEHLEQTTADAALAQEAALKAAEAALESQRRLEQEKAEKEQLAKDKDAADAAAAAAAEAAAAAAANGSPSPEASPISSDEAQENSYLKMQLKISQAQIKLLEEKMVPMIEEASNNKTDTSREDESKLKELMDLIAVLRDQNASVESAREKEREEYEKERLRIQAEKDQIMKQLIADKIAEQQRLEGKIAKEQEALQHARILAMYNGMAVIKVCRKKEKSHPVKLWLGATDQAVHYSRKGVVGAFSSHRSINLREVEKLKLGQSTPAFERNPEFKGDSMANRSMSFVTSSRTLDVIFPTANAFELWVEGVRPFLNHGKIEDTRAGAAAAAKKKEEEEKKSQQQSKPAEATTASGNSPVDAASASSSSVGAVGAAPASPDKDKKEERKEEKKEENNGFVARTVMAGPKLIQVKDKATA